MSNKIEYMPFEKAREIIRALGLKTGKDWKKYINSGKIPYNIPRAPHSVYKNEGWVNLGDWLGTYRLATSKMIYAEFEEAKKFVRNLGIKTGREWRDYYNSNEIPLNIPRNLYQTYEKKGWNGYGDFLGNGKISNKNRVYLPFEEAREFVRSLNLKNNEEWKIYKKSDKRPDNIPSEPNINYKNKGWISIGDWLGTFKIANQKKIFLSFEKAREYVHTLNIKGQSDWSRYIKKNGVPNNIPSNPRETYGSEKWKGWGDWVGSGYVANKDRNYLSFEDAKKYVHSLEIKSHKDWREYAKTNEKPNNIPSNPWGVYKEKGWISWSDWLGNGIYKSPRNSCLPFNEAREFVRSLNLKSYAEWREYCLSGKRPSFIPAQPNQTYKNEATYLSRKIIDNE